MTQKTFSEVYREIDNTTPKQAWVKRISEITQQPEGTVRMWLVEGRGQRPNPLAQKAISEELGIPAEALFPSKK